MNIQRVKQGARITYYNGIYMMLTGLVYIFLNDYNMRWNFKAISELWGFFIRYNPRISYLFVVFNILIGFLMISNGIFIIYLSDFILKRKEKMTWVILFLSGIISWVAILIISILTKNWILATINALGWLGFIIGMILPIKYYLEKNYREY